MYPNIQVQHLTPGSALEYLESSSLLLYSIFTMFLYYSLALASHNHLFFTVPQYSFTFFVDNEVLVSVLPIAISLLHLKCLSIFLFKYCSESDPFFFLSMSAIIVAI